MYNRYLTRAILSEVSSMATEARAALPTNGPFDWDKADLLISQAISMLSKAQGFVRGDHRE